MDPYTSKLAILLSTCAFLFALQPTPRPPPKIKGDDDKPREKQRKLTDSSQWPFLTVYCLVMAADWLQGPYLYALYSNEHGIEPHLLPSLFATGFLSGGVSAYFIGSSADRYGRKAACLFFCLCYSLSCWATTVANIYLLFIGRILGGVSTSLLFTVFESWMVTDFHNRQLAKKGGNLSGTFGWMSTLNSIVAIISGISSEWLVAYTGTRKSPFLASICLLMTAFWIIQAKWTENFGDSATKKQSPKTKNQVSVWTAIKDPRVLAVGLATTLFEGSMYLFVFLWTPAMKSVQSTPGELPFGTIFASFMASVLTASLLFNILMNKRLVSYTRLLIITLVVANFCFIRLAGATSESTMFWMFCLFEACVGLYWPCTGYLKGRLIEDGARAEVYGILRIPLNIFTVVSLLFSGGQDAHVSTFSTCSLLLTLAFGGLWAAIIREDMP